MSIKKYKASKGLLLFKLVIYRVLLGRHYARAAQASFYIFYLLPGPNLDRELSKDNYTPLIRVFFERILFFQALMNMTVGFSWCWAEASCSKRNDNAFYYKFDGYGNDMLNINNEFFLVASPKITYKATLYPDRYHANRVTADFSNSSNLVIK